MSFFTLVARYLDNPVVQRETRSRFRSRRTYTILLGKLLFVSILISILYYSIWNENLGNRGKGGIVAFTTLVMIEATVILLLTPSTAATSFTVEKEQRTLDLLVATRLTPFEIIYGKLAASLYWMFLLILSSAPVLFLTVFFGGLSPNDVLIALAYLIFLAGVYGVIGLYFSLRSSRTIVAVSLSLVAVLFINAGPPLLYQLLSLHEFGMEYWFFSTSPYLPLAEIVIVDVRNDIARDLPVPITWINVALLGSFSVVLVQLMILRLRKISH